MTEAPPPRITSVFISLDFGQPEESVIAAGRGASPLFKPPGAEAVLSKRIRPADIQGESPRSGHKVVSLRSLAVPGQ